MSQVKITTPMHWTQSAREKFLPPPPEALEHAENLSGAFKHASKVIRPSVVSIRSTKVIQPQPFGAGQRGNAQPAPQIPEEFRDFFGDDLFKRFGDATPFGGPRQPGEMRQQGQGTGVIFTDNGYVVTNNHVVAGADEVQVQLYDRRTFDAKVVGADAKTDVAVLKIEADGLVPAAIGNSDRIEVGDWVVAVGSPFGLQHTVTTGIVELQGRKQSNASSLRNQVSRIKPKTEVPLVVIRDGKRMTLNVQIGLLDEQAVAAKLPAEEATADEQATVSNLGVKVQAITPELAKRYGLGDNHKGVMVAEVTPGSAAQRAGIQVGSVILNVNGKTVSGVDDFRALADEVDLEQGVRLLVSSDGFRRFVFLRQR